MQVGGVFGILGKSWGESLPKTCSIWGGNIRSFEGVNCQGLDWFDWFDCLGLGTHPSL